MMNSEDKDDAALVCITVFAVSAIFLFGGAVFTAGENYGRQREYWRIAAKCPAIVKEVTEK